MTYDVTEPGLLWNYSLTGLEIYNVHILKIYERRRISVRHSGYLLQKRYMMVNKEWTSSQFLMGNGTLQ